MVNFYYWHCVLILNTVDSAVQYSMSTVQVCGFRAGPQNNWLITQLINSTIINRTRLPQVSVMIEFEQRDCDITLNCQQTFNTHIYETSSESSAGRRNVATIGRRREFYHKKKNDGSTVNET